MRFGGETTVAGRRADADPCGRVAPRQSNCASEGDRLHSGQSGDMITNGADVRMRAAGICNTFGRGATIVTPFMVVALLRSYGIGGVISLMIGLLIVQILVVFFFGVEPKNRRLEEMDSESSVSPLPSAV